MGLLSVALFDISISDIDCRYIDTFKKYRKEILENIDINIDIDKDILENIDIDIDKEILENIDIDKISNRLEFGISNRASGGGAIRWLLSPTGTLKTP